MNWLSAAPWLLSLALLIGGAGGTLWYRGEYESALAQVADIRAKAAEAIAAQKEADQQLSTQLLDQQKQAFDALRAQALSDLKAVTNAPQTNSCGPVMRASSRSVREILTGSGAGQPATRP